METKIPKWLTETQNKSWEPEILISGIALTVLFLLQDHIFNFNAMMIQELGFPAGMGTGINMFSIIVLKAVKFALVIHLILRGFWTGLIGLSYVFPNGVKKEKISKSIKFKDFESPTELVIKVEKICSLLFSFIFTFIFGLLFLLFTYSPLLLIGIFVTDLKLFNYIFITYVILIVLSPVFLSLLVKKLKFRKLLENSMASNIAYIYSTNFGKLKTSLIFGFYIILIFLFSFSDITNFTFSNNFSVRKAIITENIIRNNNYKSLRQNNLRINKAVLSDFIVEKNYVNLFVSKYKSDEYILSKIKEHSSELKKKGKISKSEKIKDSDIYTIYLNNKKLKNLNWFIKNDADTDQKGNMAILNLDDLKTGLHSVRIDKLYWSIDDDSLKTIKYWDYIPFQKL